MNQKTKSYLWKPLPYAATLLIIWISLQYYYTIGKLYNATVICANMGMVLLVLSAVTIFLAVQKKLTPEKLLWILLLCGITMRLGYTMYTHYFLRGQDIGYLTTDKTGNGHAAYILNLYYHWKLPVSFDYQFYHPPLYHLLCAVALHIFSFLHPKDDIGMIFSAAQTVGCFASCGCLLLLKDLLKHLNITGWTSCLVMAVIAFFPNFFLQAGRINNDALAFFFFLLACLLTVKWMQDKKLSSLLFTALAIGLGMMTKLSVGCMAFITGPVMLYYLWDAFKKKAVKSQILSYIYFMLICAPLGLWYSIRNFILFRQPFGYVHNIDAAGQSFVYRGDVAFAKRFFAIPVKDFFANVFANPGTDYNIPLYLLRTSIFGEFTYENASKAISRLFLNVNTLLVIVSLLAMVYVLFLGHHTNKILRFGCALVWIVSMVTYFIFNVKFPDACTMDFRYIIPTCICGVLYIGAFYNEMQGFLTQKKVSSTTKTAITIGKYLILILCGLFCLLSVLFYCNMVQS